MWDTTLEDLLYKSGDVFLPKPVKNLLDAPLYRRKYNTYDFYINGWTFLHVMSGMLIGYIYLHKARSSYEYYYTMLAIHTIWETWQIIIGMSKPYKLTGRSNLIDTIMDTIFFMTGAYSVRKFYKPV
jgi:hypothetical protein